jgi:hypothetical protein
MLRVAPVWPALKVAGGAGELRVESRQQKINELCTCLFMRRWCASVSGGLYRLVASVRSFVGH